MAKLQKTHIVGICLILLAVLIVLAAVFVPKITQKSRMKKLFSVVSEAALLTVSDPMYQTEDILGNKGKEVLPDETETAAIKQLLADMQASGYRAKGKQPKSDGGWGICLKARGSEQTVYIWLTERQFYYTDEAVTVRFEAKDAAAHAALYQKLQELLQK